MNKFKVGSIVTGTVTGLKDYGIFVKVSDKSSGLIHISEVSSKYVDDINKYAKIGDNIKVKIIDVNDDDSKLKLSIKSLDKEIIRMEETGTGFKKLGDNIEKWIDDYKKNTNS